MDARVVERLKICKVDSENKVPLEEIAFEPRNKVTGKTVAELIVDQISMTVSELLIVEYESRKAEELI